MKLKGNIFRWIGSIFLGLLVGAGLNMFLVSISGYIISPPDGANLSTSDGLAEALPLMKPRHYLFPFLAHFFGTFSSVIVACLIFSQKKVFLTLFFGFFFLLGGIIAAFIIPAPAWFVVSDLTLAYIPAACLGYWVVSGN